jgi:hypothetical protein
MLFPGMALTAPLTVLCGQVGRSVPVETGKIVNGCSGTSLTDLGLARAWNQPCSAPSTPKSVNDVSERVLTMSPVRTRTDRPTYHAFCHKRESVVRDGPRYLGL